jgi:PST family polysaccharide transporter
MILKLGVAALALGALDQFTLIFIRSVLVKSVGVDSTGIYQSVAGISNNYFAVFYMSISTYILPVLAEKNDSHEVNIEINSAFRLTLLLIIPICTITFVAREYIIMILYTDKFLPAANLMIYNFAGDFFKALSWVLGAWLIPSNRIRLWLILGFVYYLNYCVLFLLLNQINNDLRNVVIAYLIAGIIHFFLNLYFIRKYNGFKFKSGNLKLYLISFAVLCSIFAISSFNLTLGYIGFVPILSLWAWYSVQKNEVNKILSLLSIGKESLWIHYL